MTNVTAIRFSHRLPRWVLAGLTMCAALPATAPTIAQEGTSPAPAPVRTPIKPPAEEQDAIKLSGRTPNPAPEEWIRVERNGAPPGAATSPSAPGLLVFNVSAPTLEPFLPDPAKATGAAIIVLPGGGFTGLAMEHEGYSAARWLNERGIAVFVLKYRLEPRPADPRARRVVQPPVWRQTAGGTVCVCSGEPRSTAMRAAREDGLEAIRYVRAHAAQWVLSPDRIGILGFSAGALTAVNVTLNSDPASRPDLVASIYGAMIDGATVTSVAPPAFIAAASDDAEVPPAASLMLYNAFRAAGVPAELHVFENGGHGFGMMHQGKSSDQWSELFDQWLRKRGFETLIASAVH